MKCQEVNEQLVVYSDNEVSPSERTLIQVHLSECSFCQRKLAALSETQSRVSQSLQFRSTQAAIPPQTWSHLQARLAGEGRISSSQFSSWRQRLLPEITRINQIFKEGLSMKKILAWTTLATLIIAISTIIFVSPVRASVVDAIQYISLGTYSWAVQVAHQIKGESQPVPADMWIVRTDIGNFGGNAAPGMDPTVLSVSSFEEAQASTSFNLRSPTDLPVGYALREVKLAPIGGTHWVLLFYSGSNHDIIIVQMPGGAQSSTNPNEAVAIGTGFITDGTLEEVDFDGRPAVWADNHSLMWETDGISYMIGGLDLDFEQTLKIAHSLR